MGLAFWKPTLCFTWSARGKAENLVQHEVLSLLVPQFWLHPLIQRCTLGFALAVVLKLTQHIGSPTMSAHLGANENTQLMEAFPLSPRSQPWEIGRGGWTWVPPATLAQPDPGNSPLMVTKSHQFARQAHFPCLISVDLYLITALEDRCNFFPHFKYGARARTGLRQEGHRGCKV